MKSYITHILSILGIFSLANSAISQRTNRAIKTAQIKSTSKKSVGLSTPNSKITCSHPGDPKCIGPNPTNPETPFACPTGQKKTDDNTCVCEDDDYVVSPDDKTKCISKNSSTATAVKKECGNVLIKAVSAQCKDSYLHNGRGGANDDEYKCYDGNELYALFNTSNLYIYIDGKSYRYDEVCYMYTEDLMNAIAADYETTGANSIACRRSRAIANASSECFALVLSTGKALGATNAIKSNLQKTCGSSGITQQYQKLFGEVPNGLIFPTNIPDLYTNAGKSSLANGLDMMGKFLDGKLTDKTDTWEREITVINNSYLNQVSAHCGSEYALSMHNEDIQILDEKSSLQRMIDEKGVIAGSNEWASNQASVFLGENRMNQIKREGVFLGVEDADVKTTNARVFELRNGDNKLTTITNAYGLEMEIQTALQNETENIPYAIFTFKNDGKDCYRLIQLTGPNSVGDTKYTYTTINYDDNLNLPNSVLQKMIGKTEKTDFNITNGKVTK